MPTARELLEQADALMRRRHEPAATPADAEVPDSIHGPSTDSSAAITESPRSNERLTHAVRPREPSADAAQAQPTPAAGTLPGAPSVAAALSAMRWSAMQPPSTTSPVFAPPPARSPRTIQREPIAPSVARTALPVDPTESPMFARGEGEPVHSAAAPEPDIPLLTDAVDADALDNFADDLPVLTDSVDASPEEDLLLDDLGEPSLLSPTIGGPPSVTGRAPASVAVVPPVPLPQPMPPVEGDPLGLDQPPPGFAPSRDAQRAASEPSVAPPVAPPDAWQEPAVSEPTDAASIQHIAAAPTPVVEGPDEVSVPDGGEAFAAAEQPMSSGPESVDAGSASRAVLAPLDDARVREIAEEIGMQVLQRIDIFTDTELRVRLGERLTPVVERVSAELVAAINQHVGELLRAYVAEAIEREIERWGDRQP